MFGIGGFELFIILIFGFLIFGPDKLPEIAKTVGKGIARFREAQQEMNDTLGGEKIFDPNNPDEPFKDPVEMLDKLAQKHEEKQKGAAAPSASASASAAKPAATAAAASASAATASGAASAAAQATEPADDAPRQESFTERKARYERERAARKAAEAEAAKAAKDEAAETEAAKPADGVMVANEDAEARTAATQSASVAAQPTSAESQPAPAAPAEEGGDA